MAEWKDLLDPDAAAIRTLAPELPPLIVERFAAEPSEQTRPRMESGEGWFVATFLVPVAVPDEDRIFYQEVGIVSIADRVLTVRKTPPGEQSFDPSRIAEACAGKHSPPAGTIVYHLLDTVADRFLDLGDAISGEIDELEDAMERLPASEVRRRLVDLRHDILHIRHVLAPTREAVRRVVDGAVDDSMVIDNETRPFLADAYEKLLRAAEGLDFARDLVAAAREFHQSRIAEEQNDVIKKLTVTASLLLLPTLIVGVYGQNFEHMPELGWHYGYAFSWAVIALTTIGQLAFFRWRRWI
jgi:magnesium transporter